MRKTKWLQILGMSCLLAIGNLPAQSGEHDQRTSAAQKHFDRGKQLIEQNCVDCEGSTPEGMEQGIRDIEQAMRSGFRVQRSGLLLLGSAYNQMALAYAKGPEEEKLYSAKRNEVYRRLIDKNPRDVEALDLYSDGIQDRTERITIFRRILAIDPNHPGALYGLGIDLSQTGEWREGIEKIKNAIQKQQDPESVETYVQGLLEALRQHGCPLPQEGYWQQRTNEAFDKAMSGAGDANAIPAFKKDFLKAVSTVPGSHECE
jgi:tetratricopeptide (TPR) repeat protein